MYSKWLFVAVVVSVLSACGGSVDTKNVIVARNIDSSTTISSDSKSAWNNKDNDNGEETSRPTAKPVVNTNIPPSTLTYGINDRVLIVGRAIEPLIPKSSGGSIMSYEAASLPVGLNLNSVTGVISGTPSLNTARMTYPIVGKNNVGRVTMGLTLTIQALDSAPANMNYGCTVCNVTVGQAINPLVPRVTGGQPTHFAVQPTLPDGLVLDATTGVISGTPADGPSNVTLTITASNNAGEAKTTLTLQFGSPVLETPSQ